MNVILLDTRRKQPTAGFGVSFDAVPAMTCANDDYAPLGCEGAVTCDTGVELLYRIAGGR